MVKADGRGRPKGSSDGSKRKKGSGRPKGSKDKTKRKVGSGIKGHTPADLPRGRGRPKGSTNKASKVGGSKAKAGKPKKRGRPKGSKNKPASKATSAGKPKKRGRPVGSKNKPKGASAPKAVATEIKLSNYRGVYRNKMNKKWIAKITVRGKDKYLGSFHDDKDAALAYDRAVIARTLNRTLNFPPPLGDVAALGSAFTSTSRSVPVSGLIPYFICVDTGYHVCMLSPHSYLEF